jgi:hypothetical protein
MAKSKTISSELDVRPDGERAKEAYQRHLHGWTWDEIAQDMGYSSGDSARITVRHALEKAALQLSTEILDEMLQTELDTLALLQKGLMPAATLGDTKSVDSVLRVMGTRHKLLGFDKREERVTNQTLVVTSDNFIDMLKQGVEERDGKKP